MKILNWLFSIFIGILFVDIFARVHIVVGIIAGIVAFFVYLTISEWVRRRFERLREKNYW